MMMMMNLFSSGLIINFLKFVNTSEAADFPKNSEL